MSRAKPAAVLVEDGAAETPAANRPRAKAPIATSVIAMTTAAMRRLRLADLSWSIVGTRAGRSQLGGGPGLPVLVDEQLQLLVVDTVKPQLRTPSRDDHGSIESRE